MMYISKNAFEINDLSVVFLKCTALKPFQYIVTLCSNSRSQRQYVKQNIQQYNSNYTVKLNSSYRPSYNKRFVTYWDTIQLMMKEFLRKVAVFKIIAISGGKYANNK